MAIHARDVMFPLPPLAVWVAGSETDHHIYLCTFRADHLPEAIQHARHRGRDETRPWARYGWVTIKDPRGRILHHERTDFWPEREPVGALTDAGREEIVRWTIQMARQVC